MRISDTEELGELLQKEFGGKLITDDDTIQVTNTNRTTQRDIESEIIKYYKKTLKCISYSMLAFENKEGFETVRLIYTPKPTNRIFVSIIDMEKQTN